MRTLIIPCAGRSSRFPNTKPKFLLTHPDGKLMVKKAISGLDWNIFDRIVITIVKEHDERYEAGLILNQVFNVKQGSKFEIVVLDDFTSCQAETVAKTIEKAQIDGEIVIKDSDNFVAIDALKLCNDAVVGINIETFREEISRLNAKSFMLVNEQDIITDIIEKRIKSQYICIGIYCFRNTKIFLEAYNMLKANNLNSREIYISHVVSYLIGIKKSVFRYLQADDYEDWGTIKDWVQVQKRLKTYFVDLDGVLLKNRGKYGSSNWDTSCELIEENVQVLKRLSNAGAQIVITTSREEKYRKELTELLEDQGIQIHAMVMECHHACRVIINDFASTNPYPSCCAINIPRNGRLTGYITEQDLFG